MDEKQYLKMRAKAEEEFKKNLEAIDRVWHMSHPDKAPPKPVEVTAQDLWPTRSPHELQPSNGHKPFVLSEAVKQIILDMPNGAEVSQPLILQKLLAKHPELRPRVEKDQIKAQIAGMLSRMAKRDDAGIERIRESHGSEPSVFRKGSLLSPDP